MTSGLTGHLARAAAVCAAVICSGALAAGCGGRGGVASATASATASGPAAAPGEATAPAAGEVRASHAAPSTALGIVPAPAHIVLVVLENHSYGDIIGNPAAPFISGLARQGALFTRSFAVTHPSEPNYLALFSGATDGITDDSCPHTFRSPNLAADLAAAHRSFTGYAESLPARGSAVCVSGEYARKHVPWADFANVPAASSQPLANFPGADLAALPTVAWVIPNLCHDMHDCSVSTGDSWLRQHLGGYARWTLTHDSLLIVTWDEDDGSAANHIPTIFVGQPVRAGRYGQRITHYNVLATIEAAYHLRRDGLATAAAPITGVWSGGR
ncbi:MAG TPA: alkaline phosphatase family protein [Streptosporangiaceae bacterium]|nr:alkaline phosphatase family protein [Streptosporangiaceae bacterium]